MLTVAQSQWKRDRIRSHPRVTACFSRIGELPSFEVARGQTMKSTIKFGMMGAAGFVAPRHMQAIKKLGGTLLGACDPYDGAGILDRYFPDCRFFVEVERFDRFLE